LALAYLNFQSSSYLEVILEGFLKKSEVILEGFGSYIGDDGSYIGVKKRLYWSISEVILECF